MFNNPVTPQFFADRMTGKLANGGSVRVDHATIYEAVTGGFEVVMAFNDNLPIAMNCFNRATLHRAYVKLTEAKGKNQYCGVYEVAKVGPTVNVPLTPMLDEFETMYFFFAACDVGGFIIVRGTTKTKKGRADVLNFKGGYHGLDKLPAGAI